MTQRSDVLIILGDAGINFFGGDSYFELKRKLKKLQLTLFCIHGNHEQHPESVGTYKEVERFGGICYMEKEFPNLIFAKDGEIYEFNGRRCLVIGGAYSIDKNRRHEGLDWWADEQPSDEIKARVEQKLDEVGWKVDVVFWHTCPHKYTPYESFSHGVNQSLVDKSTEIWLDKIEDRLCYKEWYCGHFHLDMTDGKMLFFYRQFREIFRRDCENIFGNDFNLTRR